MFTRESNAQKQHRPTSKRPPQTEKSRSPQQVLYFIYCLYLRYNDVHLHILTLSLEHIYTNFSPFSHTYKILFTLLTTKRNALLKQYIQITVYSTQYSCYLKLFLYGVFTWCFRTKFHSLNETRGIVLKGQITSSPLILRQYNRISELRILRKTGQDSHEVRRKQSSLSIFFLFATHTFLPDVNLLLSKSSWQPESRVNRRLPFQKLLHRGVREATTPFPGLLHITLDPYLIMLSTIFESLA